MMSDYEAKDTFQRIIAQIVERLVREGETGEAQSGEKRTSQGQSLSEHAMAQRRRP